MAARSPRRPTRLAAWVVTGPVGHLAAGVADLLTALWTARRSRSRGG